MKRFILIVAFFSLLVVSCTQKGFESFATGQTYYCEIKVSYDHRWHLVIEDGPDWEKLWDKEEYFMTYESLLPTDPEGLRALVYNEDARYDVFNMSPYGGIIDIKKGNHTLLLYNNDTEYIIFNDIDKVVDAVATTRQRSRSSYMGSSFVDADVNENTITPPDMLYARNGGEFKTTTTGEVMTMEFELRPLVYKYLLRYHFDYGLEHVSRARGAFAGMASAVYLADGQTTKDAATLLFDIESEDSFVLLDDETGQGIIYAVVNSFGIPDYPNNYYTRAESSQGLRLEVILTNGKAKNFDFDVTDQVHRQPRGGVIDVYGLGVQDEDAEVGEGSFGVDVGDWGDYIEVPFM